MTRSPFFSLLAVTLGAALFAFGGCADSLHLDPEQTSSLSQGGGGGTIALGCISNTDCAWQAPICDVPKQTCVECLVLADCAGMVTIDGQPAVCSKGACIDRAAPPPDPTGGGGAGGATGSGGDPGTGGTIDPTTTGGGQGGFVGGAGGSLPSELPSR